MRTVLRFAVPVLCLALVPSAAHAQRFPAVGGIDLRAGGAEPEAAQLGEGASMDVDLGSFIAPILRPFVGGTWFRSDVDIEGDAGELEVRGGRAGARLDLLGAARFSPYVMAAFTGLDVKADVTNPRTGELLTGFNTGVAAGGGLTVSLDREHRAALTTEGRYVWINNLEHWAAEVGLRYRPFGRGAYGRRPAARAQTIRVEAVPGGGIPAPFLASTPADSATRAALAEERQKLELLRQEIAADLAAQRDARGAATRAESDDARLRADAAEAQARREAAARMAAEARADSLARLADAAAERAADAEKRIGAALLELNRIASGVTSVRDTERGVIITLGEGLFRPGAWELAPAARAEVSRVAYVLGYFRDRQLRVEGHTDPAGAEADNQALSEKRAASVRAALIAEGIAPERVVSVGYGESRPAASNETAAGRAQNRRVEIVITDLHMDR